MKQYDTLNTIEKKGEVNLQKLTITTAEAAAMFGIPKGTLNNLRYQKRGPKYFKRGKRCLYKPQDILRWIEERPVMTTDSISKG